MKEMYKISKLARRISRDLELSSTYVWDILDELGYEVQELTEEQIREWRIKVNFIDIKNNMK